MRDRIQTRNASWCLKKSGPVQHKTPLITLKVYKPVVIRIRFTGKTHCKDGAKCVILPLQTGYTHDSQGFSG